MPEEPSELLKMSLSAAVPLWIAQFKDRPWKEISQIASEASQFIAEHGDDILFKSKKRGATAQAFNHLAKGIAALSFVPGGVKIFGLHFEARHEGGESATAVAIPRNLTFEKGTIGRIVLARGLEFEATPAETNPLVVDETWGKMAKHFEIRLTDRDGREFVTPWSYGIGGIRDIEWILATLGDEALDVERAQGSPERYADLFGYDPEDPKIAEAFEGLRKKSAELRAFLGDATYEQLLSIMEEQG